jgi:predicted alpha/beta superfamily hydrolase
MYVTALNTGDEPAEPEDKDAVPVFSMFSKKVKDSFSLFVRLPHGYNASREKRYAVMYVLDANVYFGYLADSLNKMNDKELILVGVGYKNFAVMDSLRNRDYTYPKALSRFGFGVSGGGNKFYQFVTEELMPVVNKRYRTDKANCILAGHSLGGYFTLYALLKELDENATHFNSYIAASPSVEYAEEYLLQKYSRHANKMHSQKLFISCGTLEDDDDAAPGTYEGKVKKLADAIKGSVELQQQVYPYAGHMETALPSFYKALNGVKD